MAWFDLELNLDFKYNMLLNMNWLKKRLKGIDLLQIHENSVLGSLLKLLLLPDTPPRDTTHVFFEREGTDLENIG